MSSPSSTPESASTAQTPNGGSEKRPRGSFRGFKNYLSFDIKSGFLVFLIALPLCLGISLASGYPPLAGIFTAIVGSILTTFISNSELTIKGPAAGLIVITLGCIQDFGGDGATGGFSEVDMSAYQAALAVGVVAALLQIAFAFFRGGILGEFFPSAAVHGMLAAIGVIIILKQLPVAFGVEAKGEPLEILKELPALLAEANPAIAVIGITSLVVMFGWPIWGKKLGPLQKMPAPLVVLLLAIPLGLVFDLLHEHSYVLQGHKYQLGEQFLVDMPDKVFGMFEQMTGPDFGALKEGKAWRWVFMFFAIGSLESLLSAKAVDLLDPWKRKTNLNRDMLAVGTANLAVSFVGGLPMISEIVRSKANIDNGARTRFADLWHGIFLLACVALLPTFLHLIPRAALAAMLVYTGFRLAHPNEFINVYRIGREQLLIFVTTLVAVLATDLLIGIAIGIAVKMVIHLSNGVPVTSLFKPYLEVEQTDDNRCTIHAHQSAVFSNWIPFRRELENVGLVQRQNVTLDLSDTKFVDHSTMEKLHEMQEDFREEGLELTIIGLDAHLSVAQHELSARKRGFARIKRITVIAPPHLELPLEQAFLSRGATGFTATPCRGVGRHALEFDGAVAARDQVRIEVVGTPDVCEKLLAYVRNEVMPAERVTAYIESVDVIGPEHFFSGSGSEETTAEH